MAVRAVWAEYEARFKAVRDRTFSGRPLLQNPFANESWTWIVLPGDLYLDADLLEALAHASPAIDNNECIVVARHGSFPDEPAMRLALIDEDWAYIRTETIFGHVEVEVFSPSGDWGFVASVEGFGLLAGSDEFMARFLAGVRGGLAAIRARVDADIASGAFGYGDAGRRYAEQLVHAVGWR